MGWFNSLTDNIDNFFTGNKDRMEKAQKLREEAGNVKGKEISELQAEGRAAAGQAASDRAGIAKKQAKAASMQSGGNRLAAANAAAGAAQRASSEGYDTTANSMTSLAAQKDAAEVQNKVNSLNAQANALDAETQRKNQQRQQLMQMGTQLVSTFGGKGKGTSSDETKKVTKHTYIPAEKRVKKGE